MSDAEKLSVGFRDAVHVPYAVVTSPMSLIPGDKCCFRGTGEEAVLFDPEEDALWHGVVDPFVELKVIPAGTPFRLMVRKECFSGLTHVFEIDTHSKSGPPGTCHNSCNVF